MKVGGKIIFRISKPILHFNMKCPKNFRYAPGYIIMNASNCPICGGFLTDDGECSKCYGRDAIGENPDLPGFTNKNLDEHFGSGGKHDHSKQYPDFTKEQYAARAEELSRSSVSEHILGYRCKKGRVVRFDESTNDFVKVGRHGIMTMFKPDEGTRYFERQMIRDRGVT